MPAEITGSVTAVLDRPSTRIRLPRVGQSQLYAALSSLRWTLRALFAAPFAVLVTPWSSPGAQATPNETLLARASGIDWATADVGWVRDVYPPIATLLAIPGSAIVLGVAGVLMAGYLLQQLLDALAQRQCPPLVGGALLLIVGLNPLTAYLVVEDTADFLGLALLGLALANAYRFAAWKSTQAGFRSGVQLMLAVLVTPLAVPLVVPVALGVFLLSRQARSGNGRARRSAVVVVVFPAVSALATLTAMTLLFGRDPLGFVGHGTFERISDHVSTAMALASGRVGLLLAFAVVAAMAIGAVLARVDMVAVAAVIPLGTVGIAVLGLVDVDTVILIVPVALLVATVAQLPGSLSRMRVPLVLILGIALGAVSWAVVWQSGPVQDWLHALPIAP